MSTLTLITGGVRSGKSRYALELARARGTAKCFLATAEALDEEMSMRIARHRAERGPDFFTLEEPLELAKAIERVQARYDLILIDCLTLWASNLILRFPNAPEQIASEIKSFLEAVSLKKSGFVCVTNEVGLGLIPDHSLGRQFIDTLGSLNQEMARLSDEVVLMVSGIPNSIKGGVGARLGL